MIIGLESGEFDFVSLSESNEFSLRTRNDRVHNYPVERISRSGVQKDLFFSLDTMGNVGAIWKLTSDLQNVFQLHSIQTLEWSSTSTVIGFLSLSFWKIIFSLIIFRILHSLIIMELLQFLIFKIN